MRLKSRYLLFEIIYPENGGARAMGRSEQEVYLSLHRASDGLQLKQIADVVKRNIRSLFGDDGTGKCGSSLVVKYFSNKTSIGIIRCPREHYDRVCLALFSITSINSVPCIVDVIRVSGTIKKCEDFLIERNENTMRRLGISGLKKELLCIDDDAEVNEVY